MNHCLMLAWFGLEPWHLLLLAVVALLLYGKRLPEVGRSLGRGIAEFKKGLRDVQDEFNRPEAGPPPQSNDRPAPPQQLNRPESPATGPGQSAPPGAGVASPPGNAPSAQNQSHEQNS